jgi:hypothetical protein
VNASQPFKTLLIITAVLSLLIIFYFFADARHSVIFPPCIFYLVTGLYCPGCGSQRAFSALLHGDIWQAFNYNALFMLCLPLIIYSAVAGVLNIYREKQTGQQLFYSSLFVKISLAAIIVFWIVRNIPFHPFNLLAPHKVN